MSLPYPDPSNPALPSPLFSDVTAVRADHMRANNAAIFADLEALDDRNPALVELTGGSFKTAALANADTYNGRSEFTCTAGVTDTPYSGAWRVTGVWNPTDSSGRFTAKHDTSLDTWEINYSGGVWGSWAVLADANAIHVDVAAEISGIDEKIAVAADDVVVIEDSEASYAKKSVKVSALVSAREKLTTDAGGRWCDWVWKDGDEIICRRKAGDGQAAFIGVVLHDGTYIEKTDADITVKYDIPANGGDIGDGITGKLNNEWFIPWFYKKSDGTLGIVLTWMPRTTFSNNNPTNTLTLNQINGQNIGLLFSPDADLLVWNASAKFETWLYNTTDGHTPTGACSVSSRIATALTLDGNLSVANFSANDFVVQLNNFKPLQISDGAICSAIGTRGYRDSGIRIMSDGAGAIRQFYIDMEIGEFHFLNAGGAADYARTQGLNVQTYGTSYTVVREPYVPVDKCGILRINLGSVEALFIPYWASYGYRCNAGDETDIKAGETYMKHSLFKCREGTSSSIGVSVVGYKI